MDIESGSNPFKIKKMIDKIMIDPSSTRNLKQSLKNELDNTLFKWLEKYEGALLNYKGLKLNDNVAEIIDELPYIYASVRYKATIFSPKIGDILIGKVIQMFPTHINLLILGSFNTIIFFENVNPKILYYKKETMEWKNKKNDKNIELGNEIQFSVKKVEKSLHGILSLEGELNSKKRTGVLTFLKEKYSLGRELNEIFNSIKIEA